MIRRRERRRNVDMVVVGGLSLVEYSLDQRMSTCMGLLSFLLMSSSGNGGERRQLMSALHMVRS